MKTTLFLLGFPKAFDMNLRLQIYLYQLRLLFIICALVLDIVFEVTPTANDYAITFLLGSFLLNDLVLYCMSLLLI